ncbi:MAG: 6-bladed beta-propeller [Bacteroidales bacterium]|nr:6-bladed beta-propeller [Bacteroidales bacterium]
MNRFFLIGLIVAVLCSCNQNGQKMSYRHAEFELPHFKDTIDLTDRVEVLNRDFILVGGKVFATKDFIVCVSQTEDHINTCLFQLFDKEGNFIRGFGESGRGPGEINLVMNSYGVLSDSIFYAHDVNASKLIYYSLYDDSFSEIPFSHDMNTLWLRHAGANRVVLNAPFVPEKRDENADSVRYMVLSPQMERLDSCFGYPKLRKEDDYSLSSKRGLYFYHSRFEYNAKHDKIVSIVNNGAHIDIYGFNDNKLVHDRIAHYAESNINISDRARASYLPYPRPMSEYVGLSQLTLSDNGMLVTYVEHHDNAEFDNGDSGDVIWEFDWNLTPQNCYFVREFAYSNLSPDHKYLYGYAYINNEPFLARIPL